MTVVSKNGLGDLLIYLSFYFDMVPYLHTNTIHYMPTKRRVGMTEHGRSYMYKLLSGPQNVSLHENKSAPRRCFPVCRVTIVQ